MSETIRLLVGGELRPCPIEWWRVLHGPLPPEGFASDGCTMSPEAIGIFVLWPACYVHDYHCDSAVVHRLVANLIFRLNLWRLVRLQGGSRLEAIIIAAPYWVGVQLGGLLGIGRPG